jgi:hypothetical protein
VDITDRFAELVRGPEERCQLDLGALLIAAHARRDLDVDAELQRLDELAASCPGSDVEALTAHLCGTEGFRGDTDDYSNPRNSLLDVVLDRRLGIPISLSIVVLEVGRRLDIPLQGVGMPGHFLVRDAKDDDVFVDPFHRVQLDRAGALWSQCLRVLVPGTTVTDRRQLAAMLAANGRFDSAAQELDAIAEEGIGGVRDRIAATAMRAKLN